MMTITKTVRIHEREITTTVSAPTGEEAYRIWTTLHPMLMQIDAQGKASLVKPEED